MSFKKRCFVISGLSLDLPGYHTVMSTRNGGGALLPRDAASQSSALQQPSSIGGSPESLPREERYVLSGLNSLDTLGVFHYHPFVWAIL
jgi:hypothetical protein